MKKTIDFSDFLQAFHNANRVENFSMYAKEALFDWLVQYEEDTGEEMELDVVALCCDFSEVTIDEVRMDYDLGDDMCDEHVIDWLDERTLVIDVEENDYETYIIQNF